MYPHCQKSSKTFFKNESKHTSYNDAVDTLHQGSLYFRKHYLNIKTTLISQWASEKALCGYRTDLLVLHLVQDEDVTAWFMYHCYNLPRLHWLVARDALQGSDRGMIHWHCPPPQVSYPFYLRSQIALDEAMASHCLSRLPKWCNDIVFLGGRKSLRSSTLRSEALLSPQALTLAPDTLPSTQAFLLLYLWVGTACYSWGTVSVSWQGGFSSH